MTPTCDLTMGELVTRNATPRHIDGTHTFIDELGATYEIDYEDITSGRDKTHWRVIAVRLVGIPDLQFVLDDAADEFDHYYRELNV